MPLEDLQRSKGVVAPEAKPTLSSMKIVSSHHQLQSNLGFNWEFSIFPTGEQHFYVSLKKKKNSQTGNACLHKHSILPTGNGARFLCQFKEENHKQQMNVCI